MPERFSEIYAEKMGWPVLASPSGSGRIALNRPVCVIGARAKVNLPLNSPEISKAHALIVRHAGGVYLRDLASLNHTYVNNRMVRQIKIKGGDLIRFGPFVYRCLSGFEPGETQTPAPAELRFEGESSRRVFPLDDLTTLIGSREGCDLLVHDPEVASAHAVIFIRDGKRYIRDLSTAAGTFVNGERVHEMELEGDLQIHVGSAQFEFLALDAQVTLADESIFALAGETEGDAGSVDEDPEELDDILTSARSA